MEIFSKITYVLYRKRKALAVVMVLVALILPAVASAQADSTQEAELQKLQSTLNTGLQAITAIFWPILMIIGGLFDNSLIFDGKMGEALLDIWVQMRNIVNIIFVILLLFIALYNVLGLGENGPQALQDLQLGKAVKKFVVALILVNFSFLGAKVALDFTNVLTTAAFNLPRQIEAGREHANLLKDNESIVCDLKSPLSKVFCSKEDGTQSADKKFNAFGKKWFKSVDQNNIGLAMAMQFGQLQYATRITDSVEGIFQLTFNMLFGLVLYVVYAISFIVLFIVLVARLPVLWVMIALSPLIALATVFPPIAKLGGGESSGLSEKFLKHAIAPLIIGIFLSIGYIMLSAMKLDPGAGNGNFNVSILDIDPNALFSRIDDLQEFLMAAAVIAVVWMGVFAAAKDTVASGVTDKIRSTAVDWGQFLGKLPLFAQVIPVKGGKSIGLGNILSKVKDLRREKETAWARPFGPSKLKTEEESLLQDNNPDGVAGKLHANPGLLGSDQSQVANHILDTLKKIQGLQQQDTDALERIKNMSDPYQRGEALHTLSQRADSPELKRVLARAVSGHTSASDYATAVRNRATPLNAGRRSGDSDSASQGGNAPAQSSVNINTELDLAQNYNVFNANPESFAGRGLFSDMNVAQVNDVHAQMNTFSIAQRADVNRIQQAIALAKTRNPNPPVSRGP